MIKTSQGSELSPLDMYTWAITLSPYNPVLWSSRAYLFYQMGHFDLAIGDAYRAQLLCEVVCDPLKRTRQPGLYTRVWDAIERHIIQLDKHRNMPDIIALLRKSTGIPYFLPAVRKTVHHIIALSLLALQCWRDYLGMEQYLTERLTMPDRDAHFLKRRWLKFNTIAVERDRKDKRNCEPEYFYERRYGFTCGRLYPYGSDPIERATETICGRINRDMEAVVEANGFGRKFEVRSDALTKQVKVCAAVDIRWGEIIYIEEPSIRGHLHDKNPLPHCENCKRVVSDGLMDPESEFAEFECSCLKKHDQPVYWCAPPVDEIESDARGQKRKNDDDDDDDHDQPKKKRKTDKDGNELPSCLEIGRALYHENVCGKNWTWLHDAMRPVSDKDEEKILTHTSEQHGTVLSLLLREAFAITLKRRELQDKPNLLAHEIDELIPLMGAEDMGDQYFPFSFAANVRVPFDILSMLGVDIFRDLTFDTWVIQLVLRKLLLNVIPWDPARRCSGEYASGEPNNMATDTPENMARKVVLFNEGNLDRWPDYGARAPAFNNLYLFPGVSMFNHRCRNIVRDRHEQPTQHNAMWDWDQTIPNRIIVWAWRDIDKGEQICLEYTPYIFDSMTDKRVLGKRCECEYCRKRPHTPPPNDTEETDSDPGTPPSLPRSGQGNRRNKFTHIDLVSSDDDNEGTPRPTADARFIPTHDSPERNAPPFSLISNNESGEGVGRRRSASAPAERTTVKLSAKPRPNYTSKNDIDFILDDMSRVNKSPMRRQHDRLSLGSPTPESYSNVVHPEDLDPTPVRSPRKRPSAIRDSSDEESGNNRVDAGNFSEGGRQGKETNGNHQRQSSNGPEGENDAKRRKTNNLSSILGHCEPSELDSPDNTFVRDLQDASLMTFGNMVAEVLDRAVMDSAGNAPNESDEVMGNGPNLHDVEMPDAH